MSAAQVAHITRKKQAILSLESYMDKSILVQCLEGREIVGTLKGFDSNLNLTMAESWEYLRDWDNPEKRRIIPDPEGEEDSYTEAVRQLGVVVLRGGSVVAVSGAEDREEIENPFV